MTTEMTVTEALAELKTIQKRINVKREHVMNFLTRQEGLKDPMSKEGGSVEVIRRELQAIGDLEQRHVDIRVAIQEKNRNCSLTVSNLTKNVAEWLTWRKEIAPDKTAFLTKMRHHILNTRSQAQTKGLMVLSASVHQSAEKPSDVLINVDEGDLAKQAEVLELILGTLDGALSLFNATAKITVY